MPSSRDVVTIFLGSSFSRDQVPQEKLRSYSCKRDIFSGAGTIEMEIEWSVQVNVAVSPITFEFQINGFTMMSGWIDRVSISYSKGSRVLKLYGRDAMQVLHDNFVLTPKFYQTTTAGLQTTGPDGQFYPLNKKTVSGVLADVVQDVWEGSKAVFPNHDGIELLSLPELKFEWTSTAIDASKKLATVKKVRSTHGQTLFDFISTLVNPVGIFMYAKPVNTDDQQVIVFHKVTGPDDELVSYGVDGSPVQDSVLKSGNYFIQNLVPGTEPTTGLPNKSGQNNVISCEFTQDATDYHKWIRLVGQSESEYDQAPTVVNGTFQTVRSVLVAEAIESGSPDKGYQGLTKFKVAGVNAVDDNVWKNTKQQLLDTEFLQQNRRLYTLKYTVEGHSPDPNSQPYFINHLAIVEDDFIPGVVFSEFLTYGVEYRGSNSGGITTVLDLCRPGKIDNSIIRNVRHDMQVTGI